MEQVVAELFDGISGNACSDTVCPDIADKYHRSACDHDKSPFHYEGDVIFRSNFVNNIGKNVRDQKFHNGSRELDRESVCHRGQVWFHVANDVFHSIVPPKTLEW